MALYFPLHSHVISSCTESHVLVSVQLCHYTDNLAPKNYVILHCLAVLIKLAQKWKEYLLNMMEWITQIDCQRPLCLLCLWVLRHVLWFFGECLMV